LNNSARTGIPSIVKLLSVFLALDAKFPLSYAIVFLEVAGSEGITLQELHRQTGMPVSTLSRITGALSDRRQKNARSYGLLRRQTDPGNTRRKPFYLTPEGKKLLHILESTAGFQ
jgi:DNA-binding MarR family transcriptional regulator